MESDCCEFFFGAPTTLKSYGIQQNRIEVSFEKFQFIKSLKIGRCNVSVKRILVCNVIEKLAEHGIHRLPGSYTNDIIDQLP